MFVHSFGSCECWPRVTRGHSFKNEKIIEEVSIEKALSIDFIAAVGEEKVSVMRLQLLSTWVPLRNASALEKVRTSL